MSFIISKLARSDDPLYRNALFLTLASALVGLFGFLFWLLVARFYTSEAIGISASLLALASFLGLLSSLGLGVGLTRFLPSTSGGRNRQINASLTLTALTALGLGLVFLGGVSLWSPAVAFVRTSWPFAVTFLAFTVGFALTPIADGSFLAARKASYVLQRSLLYSGLRLPLPVLVATSLGAFGIFFSSGVTLLFALIVSFLYLVPRLYPGFLAVPSFQFSGMRSIFSYSIGNHIAGLLRVLPTGILPLLILSEMSASSSAHFYIVWIMAGFLFMVPISFAQSLFVEGSHPGTQFIQDTVRSLRFGLLLLVPGILFLYFAGPFLLDLFGAEYSSEGLGLLRILALSAFFVAINSTFASYLMVSKKIGELVLISAVLGVGTLVASFLLLDTFRLIGPGIALLSVQGAVAVYILIRNLAVSKRIAKELIRF